MESRSEIGGSTLLLQGTYHHLLTKDIVESLPYFLYNYAHLLVIEYVYNMVIRGLHVLRGGVGRRGEIYF